MSTGDHPVSSSSPLVNACKHKELEKEDRELKSVSLMCYHICTHVIPSSLLIKGQRMAKIKSVSVKKLLG